MSSPWRVCQGSRWDRRDDGAGTLASMEETGLYPRKAAKTALVAGMCTKYWLSCGTPAVVRAEPNAEGRLVVSEEMIIVKKIARLMV